MKYLKNFETTPQYQEYIEGEDAILPNVSCVKDDNQVYYNPKILNPLEAAKRLLSQEGFVNPALSEWLAAATVSFSGGYSGVTLYCAGINASNQTKAIVFATEQTYYDCSPEGTNPKLVSRIFTKALNQMVANVQGMDEFEVMQTTSEEMQKLVGQSVVENW